MHFLPRYHYFKTAFLSVGVLLSMMGHAATHPEYFYTQYQREAEKIVSQMSLEEKIGQMLLPTFNFITANRGPEAMAEAQAAWFNTQDLYELGEICGFQAITKFHIGSVLQDAGPLSYSGEDQSLAQWKKVSTMANLFYNGPEGTHLLLGTDSVHGDQHVTGTILFPHNIGLGATHNPNLVEQIGFWNGRNMQTSGFNWSFSPTVAVGHDYRWGRFYESYTSNLSVLRNFAFHYTKGLQDIVDNKYMSGVLANAKHFIGDGDTVKGIDEGYAYSRSLECCWKRNGAGYEGAVNASLGSIMASYSSLNDIPMHFGGAFNILDEFRNKGIKGSKGHNYRLEGFVVSDFVGVSRAAYKCSLLPDKCGLFNCHENLIQLDGCLKTAKKLNPLHPFQCFNDQARIFELYVRAVAKAINAGLDMLMIANNVAFLDPFDYDPRPPFTMLSPVYYTTKIQRVVNALTVAVESGLISQEKLNDTVTRIIRVKLSMSNPSLTMLAQNQLEEEAAVSLQAAEQSLVLLKNEKNLLPIHKESIENVFLIGAFDDIGTQNGGWTVTWQGQKGNQYWPEGSIEKQTAHATSILDGLKGILGNVPSYIEGEEAILASNLNGILPENSIAIVVIAEPPYAEYNGDIDNGNPWYTRGTLMGENKYNSPIQPDFLGVVLTCDQLRAIEHLKSRGVKVVTVLFSGRPVVITGSKEAPLNHSDAFVAAFLPGTSGGEAIANAIFGKYGFKSITNKIDGKIYHSNTLPFAWPANMEEVRAHHYTLFPLEYGLKTEAF